LVRQHRADKLSRDCQRIVIAARHRKLFPARLPSQHQAVTEFATAAPYLLGLVHRPAGG